MLELEFYIFRGTTRQMWPVEKAAVPCWMVHLVDDGSDKNVPLGSAIEDSFWAAVAVAAEYCAWQAQG